MLTVQGLARFRRDRRGVSAVEFALVAPIMLAILMATVEIPRAFSYSQKLTRASRTMADLIARDNLASLDDIYAAGLTIAQPIDPATISIRLAAVGVYAGSAARACSTAGRNAVPQAVNSAMGTAPPAFAATGSRYVIAEVSLAYDPIFDVLPGFRGLVMNRQTIWPIRKGTAYFGDPEAVLPGGSRCPQT